MKEKIIIAISVLSLLAQSSCKKCYTCSNECCKIISTQQLICNNDFGNDNDYFHALDSLGTDVQCSVSTDISVVKEACSEEEKEYLEQNERLGCMKKRKN